MHTPRRLFLKKSLSFFLLGMAGFSGCKEAAIQFNNVDITGATYGENIHLIDQNGQSRSFQDFPGKVVAVFFGYTQCPDICPTTLVMLKEVIKQLGSEGDRIEVLFITLDPQRDTPELLKQYMAAFGPTFLGLRGTPKQTDQVAKSFKVFYEKQGNGENYLINHTAGIYLFDPKGRPRLFVRQGETVPRMVADIRLLLGGK